MNTPDRAHLRKLADAASQPPWRALGQYVSADGGRDGIAAFATDADAEFIAAARSAVPALLDENDALRARIKAVEAVIETHRDYDGSRILLARLRSALDGDA